MTVNSVVGAGATGLTSSSRRLATGLNYASDYRNVDGIVIPTKRRVYAYEGDYQPVWDPLLVKIDMGDITLA